MQSLWSETDAQAMVAEYDGVGEDLALRVYSSRLLGGDPRLVLHGGGNTSVKTTMRDISGDELDVLCVKGSGWDLGDIEPPGLPAVRLHPIRALSALDALSDEDMVNVQRSNLLDSTAPNPSVETLLHAFLPHKFVDHTHADAVLALTDQPDGDHICGEVYGDRMALVMWDIDGTNPRRVYQDDVTVMGLEWSRDGRWLTFGAGGFFLDRSRQPADIMIMKADGSDVRAVTSGPGNAGFPSWSPDGTEIVYRYWTANERGEGLRIVDVATGKSRVLTAEYDTLPFWSPTGDVIMFTRYVPDDRFPYDEFDIYTIRPDGTALNRLTDAEGNDAHSLWSPDGTQILWSSSRFGYKDESPLVINQPQPYAELFIMNADGSHQRPLTDNQYEEGTPAWLPVELVKPRSDEGDPHG